MGEGPEDIKNIYQLKLHEGILLQSGRGPIWNIMRVPGSWLYTKTHNNVDQPVTPVFIPYDKEFIKTK